MRHALSAYRTVWGLTALQPALLCPGQILLVEGTGLLCLCTPASSPAHPQHCVAVDLCDELPFFADVLVFMCATPHLQALPMSRAGSGQAFAMVKCIGHVGWL